MSIALCLKVNDGVVLAADSAATVSAKAPTGQQGVVNIYNNANKISNLRKSLPIGVVTYGSASIGNVSIASLLKDLRVKFSQDGEWALDRGDYSMEEVAGRMKEFLYDELYVSAYEDWADKPSMGFLIAGYSPGNDLAEEFTLEIASGKCKGPTRLRKLEDVGATWRAAGEAIQRLMLGYGSKLPQILRDQLGVVEDQLEPAMKVLQSELTSQLIVPAMPIQDAIDLSEFLVNLSIKYYRYAPGAPTVGGPIEIAAITKHEGFKWVKRKHYYSQEYNPTPHNPYNTEGKQ